MEVIFQPKREGIKGKSSTKIMVKIKKTWLFGSDVTFCVSMCLHMSFSENFPAIKSRELWLQDVPSKHITEFPVRNVLNPVLVRNLGACENVVENRI
jgi:hypothetical protein